MNPSVARTVIIVIGSLTLAGAWGSFAVLWQLWRRSKRIDVRNRVIDRRIAAIGEVIVDLYPDQGNVSTSRASKKAKALGVLHHIEEHDLDEVRLAIHEVSRPKFED